MNASLSTCFLIFCITFFPQPILAEDKEEPTEQSTETKEDLLAGHSYHGEAFNEGPRQAAVLMPEIDRSSHITIYFKFIFFRKFCEYLFKFFSII